jgi:chemotaxis protein methyltransferase CheR
MNAKTMTRFCSLIYEEAGICLGESKEELVSARIGKRLRALSLPSPEAYLQYISGDESGQELVHLIDAISTNHTNFFREAYHFDILAELAGGWRKAGQRRFRFWSAACSSGEEPYTMAMALTENAMLNDCDIRILATDISTRVLAHALTGEYDPERVKGLPLQIRQRYFEECGNGARQYRVVSAIRGMIRFERLNLIAPPYPMRGPFDVVFCRNVMIYFDGAGRSVLLKEINRLLKPGGYLMVGHAESLTGLGHAFRFVHPATYRKD